jgi:hypothetical protein
MQLTILGILALGGAILLIYATLHRRPASAEHTNRRRSDDGKVIYLFNEPADAGDGRSDKDVGAPSSADANFTDVEFSEVNASEVKASEVKAEEPNKDGEN